MLPPRALQRPTHIDNHLLKLAAVFLSLALTACTQSQTSAAPTEEPATTTQEPQSLKEKTAPQPAAAEVKSFPIDTFYTLLVAEVAGIREHYDIALANYYRQAEITKDAGVAARATRIARFLNARQAALDSAQLWVELEPQSADAQLALTVELALAGNLHRALIHAAKTLQLGGDPPMQSLAATAIGHEQLTAQAKREFARLAEDYPLNDEAVLAYAMVLRTEQKFTRALSLVHRVQERHPNQLDAPLLESHLLVDLGRRQEAIALLERLVGIHPSESPLRLQYARLLIREDLALARQQFAELVRQSPEDGNLIFSLALIQYETDQADEAKMLFTQLIELQQHESAAHFYLGGIAEKSGDFSSAVKHFRQVGPGSDYVEAITRGTELLASLGRHNSNREWFATLRKKHPSQEEHFYLMEVELLRKSGEADAALQRIEEALKINGGSGRLIYTRALLHDELGNTQQFEEDLRILLERDPNNATALNALGYKLIDDKSRHAEAYRLISRALELEPEDPAIIDSMGWIEYRLGNYAAAEKYLRQAMDKHPDHEIAAHLGEVLWVQGDREAALRIWRRGLLLNPHSKLIPAAMQRLQIKESLEQHASDH
ncbi:tetratricopeptide repeat protein [Microbulbifer sp. ZKSA006]|uniref:tetratricopeptide repeat protein n=1 Tax=Microbulbifer sp. ZKSA006 TaxID=3243390 RepID=UPI00403A6989